VHIGVALSKHKIIFSFFFFNFLFIYLFYFVLLLVFFRCETWSLILREESKLRVFENRTWC